MARKRTSKTRWGWIAFWTGLTICVAAGAVVGALLGKGDSRSDADEVQRVAALALDTSRLNDDALALSLAIEEAIARDELESESEALHAELARLEWRAERIRVRAESQGSPGQSAEPVREEGGDFGGQARRALREINATLAIFERDVVVQLESVLSSQPSSEPPVGEVAEPSTDEALADVVLVLEQQGQTLTNLTNELIRARQAAESPVREDLGQGEEAADLISGSFQGALISPGYALDIGYELGDLEAEVDPVDAERREATVTGSASGELTVTNTSARRDATFTLPTFHIVLYWKDLEVPWAAKDGGILTGLAGETSASEETSFEDSRPCQYEFDGDRYCALARFAFDEAEASPDASMESTLEPDETLGIDILEADGSLLVGEREADVVADFIGSSRPELVQVLAASPDGDLRPACVDHSTELEDGEYSDVNSSTLGLLGGDGTVIFEAAEPDQPMRTDVAGNPEMPECYTVLDE